MTAVYDNARHDPADRQGAVWDSRDHNVAMEEGRWRIVRFHPDPGGFRLEHLCSQTGKSHGLWWPYTYSVANRHYPCSHCSMEAPEGLAVLFWFLKEEK